MADGYEADGYEADGYEADGYEADGYEADGSVVLVQLQVSFLWESDNQGFSLFGCRLRRGRQSWRLLLL